MSYCVLAYRKSGRPVAGILLPDKIVIEARSLLEADGSLTVEGLLDNWQQVSKEISTSLNGDVSRHERVPLSSLELLPPLTRPGQLFIAGSNYRDHADEMMKRDLARGINRTPTHFKAPAHTLKASRACIVGDGAKVKRPDGSKMFDWEAELAVIIGRHATQVPAEQALDYVAGYAVANDMSARDLARRNDVKETSPFFVDWIAHKSFGGACPLGPWITPKDNVPDPHSLWIKLSVNGTVRQDSNTSNMIFSINEQIAELSRRLPLFPGDIILTGTPAGTATSYENAYLNPGDEVKVEIQGLGTLVTFIE
jgi:2-keto-4-pentenoate hydratase/2-oxohepta-3-ene-1,7-dioic acid hydratase in catechol pathway